MKECEEKIKMIFAPRSLGVLFMQLMSIVPFSMALIIIYIIITTKTSTNFNDILIIFFAFMLPLLLVAFFMLYIPQQYRTLIIFDIKKNLLSKVKKRKEVQNLNLDIVKSVLSKTITTNFDSKHNLIFEEAGDNSHIIFNEYTPFGTGHWEAFSEKLSEIIGLPLRKEYWVEDINGQLSLIPNEVRIANKKRGLLIISILLSLSFVGAVGYTYFPTFKGFILVGSATIFINICLSFIYALSYRDQIGDWANNNFTLAFYIMTLLIPYSLFYLFFVLVLNGFRLPF